MPNTPRGEALLADRRFAEDALRALAPELYSEIEHWLDKDLYGGFWGHGGAQKIPETHLRPIRALLEARAAVYRGRKTGDIEFDGIHHYESEVGNERMAQAIEACLADLGEGPTIAPRGKHWEDFWPRW